MGHLKNIEDKIIRNHQSAVDTIEKWKADGDKVVFTNGCFDLLHQGHIDYLCKAADLGNKLVVGLNTDNSVKRLKGEQRPIIAEQSRALLLAALQFIDLVVLFDENTPYELISKIFPDILVKGNDYTICEIAGHDIVTGHGGKVITVDLLESFSTSSLIEKIKQG